MLSGDGPWLEEEDKVRKTGKGGKAKQRPIRIIPYSKPTVPGRDQFKQDG